MRPPGRRALGPPPRFDLAQESVTGGSRNLTGAGASVGRGGVWAVPRERHQAAHAASPTAPGSTGSVRGREGLPATTLQPPPPAASGAGAGGGPGGGGAGAGDGPGAPAAAVANRR